MRAFVVAEPFKKYQVAAPVTVNIFVEKKTLQPNQVPTTAAARSLPLQHGQNTIRLFFIACVFRQTTFAGETHRDPHSFLIGTWCRHVVLVRRRWCIRVTFGQEILIWFHLDSPRILGRMCLGLFNHQNLRWRASKWPRPILVVLFVLVMFLTDLTAAHSSSHHHSGQPCNHIHPKIHDVSSLAAVGLFIDMCRLEWTERHKPARAECGWWANFICLCQSNKQQVGWAELPSSVSLWSASRRRTVTSLDWAVYTRDRIPRSNNK